MLRFAMFFVVMMIFTCTESIAQTPTELVAMIRDGHKKLALAEASYSKYRWTLESLSPAESKDSKTKSSLKNVYGICYEVGEQRMLEAGMLVDSGGPMKEDPKRSRICKSNHYTFVVWSNSATSGWALKFFDDKKPKESFNEVVGGNLPALFPLRTLVDQWKLEDILDNETCKISSVRSNSGSVTADFFAKVGPEKNLILKGSFTASKDNDFVITECQYTLTDSANTNAHFISTMTRDVRKLGDTIICSAFGFKSKNTVTGNVDFEENYKFSEYSTELLESSQFELEYYGIASPQNGMQQKSKGLKWPFWLGIVATSIVLAVFFRLLARRSK